MKKLMGRSLVLFAAVLGVLTASAALPTTIDSYYRTADYFGGKVQLVLAFDNSTSKAAATWTATGAEIQTKIGDEEWADCTTATLRNFNYNTKPYNRSYTFPTNFLGAMSLRFRMTNDTETTDWFEVPKTVSMTKGLTPTACKCSYAQNGTGEKSFQDANLATFTDVDDKSHDPKEPYVALGYGTPQSVKRIRIAAPFASNPTIISIETASSMDFGDAVVITNGSIVISKNSTKELVFDEPIVATAVRFWLKEARRLVSEIELIPTQPVEHPEPTADYGGGDTLAAPNVVTWTLPDGYFYTHGTVQRAISAGGPWTDVAAWTSDGALSYEDETALTSVRYFYRLVSYTAIPDFPDAQVSDPVSLVAVRALEDGETPVGPVFEREIGGKTVRFGYTQADIDEAGLPEAPAEITFERLADGIVVHWTPGKSVHTYSVDRSDGETGPWTEIAAGLASDILLCTNVLDSVESKSYYYRVRAVKGTDTAISSAFGCLYYGPADGTGLRATYAWPFKRSGTWVACLRTNLESYVEAPAVHLDAEVSLMRTIEAPDYGMISWKGKLIAPLSGAYDISATTDHGVAMYIDDIKLFDAMPATGAERLATQTKSLSLAAGEHDVVIYYTHMTGPKVFDLKWGGVISPAETIPQSQFKPAEEGDPWVVDGWQYNVYGTNGEGKDYALGYFRKIGDRDYQLCTNYKWIDFKWGGWGRHFAAKRVSGDFTLDAKILDPSTASTAYLAVYSLDKRWTFTTSGYKAGNTSVAFGLTGFGDGNMSGGNALHENNDKPSASDKSFWLRIRRIGKTYYAYGRATTADPWILLGEKEILTSIGDECLVGFGTSSINNSGYDPAVIKFTNVRCVPYGGIVLMVR